jgi:hypothetical protein
MHCKHCHDRSVATTHDDIIISPLLWHSSTPPADCPRWHAYRPTAHMGPQSWGPGGSGSWPGLQPGHWIAYPPGRHNIRRRPDPTQRPTRLGMSGSKHHGSSVHQQWSTAEAAAAAETDDICYTLWWSKTSQAPDISCDLDPAKQHIISCLAAPAGRSSTRQSGCPGWRGCRLTEHMGLLPWADQESAAVQTQLPAPSSACQPDTTPRRQVTYATQPDTEQTATRQKQQHKTQQQRHTSCDTAGPSSHSGMSHALRP